MRVHSETLKFLRSVLYKTSLVRRTVAGVDLAGTEKNPTGVCILDGMYHRSMIAYRDSEILEKIISACPEIIAIDAPLTMPVQGYERNVERIMRSMGYRLFPPLLGGMKKLTIRGVRLNSELKRRGFRTIEVHPLTSRKILGIPERDLSAIRRFFLSIGVRGDVEVKNLSIHEIDALTAAVVALLHLEGLTTVVGDEEGYIVCPRLL